MEFKDNRELAVKKAHKLYPYDIWGSDYDTKNRNTGFVNGYLHALDDFQVIDELKTDIDQLEVWIEDLKDLEKDDRYIGITESMKKCISEKKELIKKATEI